ncbi:hypothetical protein BCR39DRAFT_511389 [Naematelia encephala]|uniref:DUF726-domain-containing protein n=1 Tax=Naematelia encephala TaxID=71784 RepID=A0A1Y2BND1_9TREE|nr:hypothetical protein BCR39DRAFT_511389 [Naematelia encephala]
MPSSSESLPKPPPPLSQPIRLLVALSSHCATLHPISAVPTRSKAWYATTAHRWISSVCKLLEFDTGRLPPDISPEDVERAASCQIDEWSEQDKTRMAGILVEASLAMDADEKKKDSKDQAGQLRYTPIARAWCHRSLSLLGLSPVDNLPKAETNLSSTLFAALKAASTSAEDEEKEKVEATRAAHAQGWGGSFGRHLATGAGVIAGGVLIGVTGGLAAPAIAALLAPLGIGGILSAGAAPVVLGTLFGVGGGGLAGRRVRERWRGVEEFGFVEVGNGTKATIEEIEDLKEARRKLEERKGLKQKEEDEKKKEQQDKNYSKEDDDQVTDKMETLEVGEGGEISDEQAQANVEDERAELSEQLLDLSRASGTRSSVSYGTTGTARTSTDSPRPSLDTGKDDKSIAESKKPPSLTATIVVPGMLTVSKTEAITAWRAICSDRVTTVTKPVSAKDDGQVPAAPTEASDQGDKEGDTGSDAVVGETIEIVAKPAVPPIKIGLKDGRDVYLLRYESETMLKTGRALDLWVEGKIKGKITGEIIKRTVLSAYFAAVALPRTVYSMSTTVLDNTWLHAQDRANKAGRILGEVLEKRVQGERPVILIGSSIGCLTVFQALQYLASLPTSGSTPAYVESAILISMPLAPSPEEWAKCRGVVARRLVNVWSDADFVLAGVARLHEVVSRAATLQNGTQPAGLGPVNQPGVQDIDVSKVLRGHMQLQTKMSEIIRIVDLDA